MDSTTNGLGQPGPVLIVPPPDVAQVTVLVVLSPSVSNNTNLIFPTLFAVGQSANVSVNEAPIVNV